MNIKDTSIPFGMRWCHLDWHLTNWGRDKMAAFSKTTFSTAFSSIKMFEFRLQFHWSLFPRVQLTIFQHWFRSWLGAVQATSHYLNQWWLVYRRIYAWLGLNELRQWLNTHLQLKASFRILWKISKVFLIAMSKISIVCKYRRQSTQYINSPSVMGTRAHYDVIKWKHFARYWPFVRGIHRSREFLHKGQWRGTLMLSLISSWINGWVNNREAGYLRRHRIAPNMTSF